MPADGRGHQGIAIPGVNDVETISPKFQDRVKVIAILPAPGDGVNGLIEPIPKPIQECASPLLHGEVADPTRQMQHPNHSPANGSKFPPIRK